MIHLSPIAPLAILLLVTTTISRLMDYEPAFSTLVNGRITVRPETLGSALSAPSKVFPVVRKQKRNDELPTQPAIAAILSERQDIADLPLQGADGVCGEFSFSDHTFSALCLSTNGSPVESRLDLNACYVNSFGSLQPLASGSAFDSCSSCSLAAETLDLTCSCALGAANKFDLSTINLDGTTEVNGNGIFVQDNGKIACRAPE